MSFRRPSDPGSDSHCICPRGPDPSQTLVLEHEVQVGAVRLFCILAFFCACRGILHGLAERGTSAATPVPLLQPLNLQPSLHPTTGTRPMLSPPCSMHVWQQLMPHKSVVDSAGPTNSALNLLELTLGWQCVCGFQGTFSHGIVCTRWACW